MPSTEYHLPALPLGQPAAEIVRWLKRPGDQLAQGEPLLLVLGERAEVLLPAPAAGVLSHLLAAAGATVRPGDALASITASVQAETEPGAPAAARQRATPLARRLAGALGVDLALLAGSGPGGAVRKADVLAAAGPPDAPACGSQLPAAPGERAAARPQPAAAPPFVMRPVAADTDTHGVAVMRCDFGQVLAVCAKRAPAFAQRGLPLDPLLCVAAAVVEALLRHPQFHSHWHDGSMRVPRRISLAISRPCGTRLIENAHDLNLRGLARAYARSTAPAARAGSFTLVEAPPEQLWRQPAPGQGTALVVGAPHARPASVREQGAERIGMRPTALLALAYDIRLADQRQADAFLGEIVARLARFAAGVAGV